MQSRLMPINSSLSAASRWSWDGLIHACLCFSEEIFCKLQNSTQEGSSSFCQEKSQLKKRAQQSWEEQFPHGTALEHGDKEQHVTTGRRCLVCAWLADPQGKWKQKNLEQLQHECIGKNEWKHVVYESLRFCAQTLTLGRGQEKFTLTAPALATCSLIQPSPRTPALNQACTSISTCPHAQGQDSTWLWGSLAPGSQLRKTKHPAWFEGRF